MTYEDLLDVKRAIEKLEHDMRTYNVDVHEYVTVEELVIAIQCIEKLTHYEDLEEQGRLIELPCAVGDVLYDLNKEFAIREISFWEDDCDSYAISIKIEDWKGNFEVISAEDIGETVFLTKEEAEAQLKELRGDEK